MVGSEFGINNRKSWI